MLFSKAFTIFYIWYYLDFIMSIIWFTLAKSFVEYIGFDFSKSEEPIIGLRYFITTEFIFFYSILLILLGFLLKLCDTFKVLNPNKFGSGTGWFHLFTALGLLFVWYGFQLLPSNKNHMIL